MPSNSILAQKQAIVADLAEQLKNSPAGVVVNYQGITVDADTKMRLEQGERIVEVLKQDRNSPVSVEHQVVIIYAVINDYLKDIAVEDIRDFEKSLFDYVDNTYPKIISNIAQTGELSSETEEMIKNAVTECVQKFLSRK